MTNSLNNIDITSFINFPIKIDAHEHPLLLCICKRPGGWECDKCSNSYENTPSFYCTYCDYDLCQKCLGEYKLNQVKICERNSKVFNIIRNESNNNIQWQRKFPCHKHSLSLIYKTKKSSWTCNKCSNKYHNSDKSLYYCSICDYNICDKCEKTFVPIKNIKKDPLDKKGNNTIELTEDTECSKSVVSDKKKFPTIYRAKPTTINKRKMEVIKAPFKDIRTNIIKNPLEKIRCNNTEIDNSNECCEYSDSDDSYYIPKKKEKPRKWIPIKCRRVRTCRKPVIYLYPEKEMDISVQLDINRQKSKLTVLYPNFNEDNNTWKVHANPNGDIKLGNKIYPYLFWEAGSYNCVEEKNEGFIVKDVDAEAFLEDKLKLLGLNDKESTDFITYWLPVLLKNKISLCSFQTEKFFDNFKLNVSPKPDTMIRIFLSIKKINVPFDIKEQKLEKNERRGYTLIEWGGSSF